MAAPARNASREHKDSCELATLLSSAFFEWLLIILLFLDAIFSYLAARLARFCKLQTPCLFCSRLDHVWGSEKLGFYKELLCTTHKLEIASLAYCHVHRKLGDVQEMCERCLLAFTEKKNPNSETCLQELNYGEDTIKVPLLKNDLEPGSLCTKNCSCCSEAYRIKPYGNSLPQLGIPLSGKTGHSHAHHPDGLSKRKGKSSRSPPIYNLGNHGFDHLSRVGYSELKITSDSESEVPFSDEDDGNALSHGVGDIKEELVDRCLHPVHATIVREKLIHPTPTVSEPSLIALERQQAGVYNSKTSITSNVAIGHGLEEINWSQIEARDDLSVPSEFVPEQIPTESSNVKYVMQIGDATLSSTASNGDVAKALSSTTSNDACKVSNGNLASSPPTSIEIAASKEANKVQEDLRLLLSQISASRGLEFTGNEMSPSPRLSNASSTNSKRFSLEPNESILESLIVNEIEGESPVDRMKRQIELDRKTLTLLFKELEEERSASTIAANQAMAMINRLQEEKAAMQMEAWQYQRMMEEQAEYDQEALEKLNDLLAEREKDIQDLEAEIDSYRKRFGEEPLGDSVERDYSSRTSTPRAIIRSASRQNSYRSMEAGWTPSRFMKDSLMDIEDEKAYMLQCLKRLEKKLEVFSSEGEDNLAPTDVIINGVNRENGNGQLESGTKIIQFSEELMEANEMLVEMKDSTQINAKENHRERRLCYSSSTNNMQYPTIGKTCDLIVLGDEVSQLNERLEALEADRDFLDRAINSLKNGSDGVQFIREIACHLRELRRIGIRLRKNMVI